MLERWKGEIKSDLYHCCSGLASHGRLLGSVYLLSVEVSSFCWWPTMAGRAAFLPAFCFLPQCIAKGVATGRVFRLLCLPRHLVLMWHAVAMFHSCCLSVASIFFFFLFFTSHYVYCSPLTRFISCSSSFPCHHSYCSSHIQNTLEMPISLPLSNPMFSASLSSRHLPFFPVFVKLPFFMYASFGRAGLGKRWSGHREGRWGVGELFGISMAGWLVSVC
jgi:hypothetical protein